jgi:hypothetical protein
LGAILRLVGLNTSTNSGCLFSLLWGNTKPCSRWTPQICCHLTWLFLVYYKTSETRRQRYFWRSCINWSLFWFSIEKVHYPESVTSFYSTLFLVLKKTEKMRMVTNMKPLNIHLKKIHFKMNTMSKVLNLVSLSPMRHGFTPSFVNYKKGCTQLTAASDKVYQLLAQGRWFSPGTLASFTTKTGRHF